MPTDQEIADTLKNEGIIPTKKAIKKSRKKIYGRLNKLGYYKGNKRVKRAR